MKKLLILGASILQLPAIVKAKEMGMYVGVIDYNENAIGRNYADEFFCISTIDIEGVVAVAEHFKPDGVFTLATDMPMRAVAAVCEKLGLPGIDMDTAIRATDKGEMIKAFEAHNVEHPWYYIVDSECSLEKVSENLSYPCICKPVDNSGSRGVILIRDASELKEAFSYSTERARSGTVIIEEYLCGEEVSVEVIVIDGVAHVLQITDKLTTRAPHFVEIGHSQPSILSGAIQDKIKDLAVRAVMAVGICDGAAHVEIIVTEDGPKMVELGARMGGDCITTHLVPLSTGIDMMKAAINIACGESAEVVPRFRKGAAIRYMNAPSGRLSGLDGIEDAKNILGVQQVSVVKQIGQSVGSIASSGDRIGFVITQADSSAEAVAIADKALAAIKISID